MAAEDKQQTSKAMHAALLRGSSRRQGEGCLSDLQLDQVALGELVGVEEQRARLHLSQCDPCEEAFKAIEADRASFASQVNVADVAAHLVAQANTGVGPIATTGLRRWLGFLAWPAVVSASAALALVYLSPVPASVSDSAAQVRAKGVGLSLSAFVKFAGQDQPGALHMGEPLGAGDRVQFRVSTPRAGHLAILSLDSRGEVSVFYPPTAETARVPAGRDQALGTAVELDDSPGQETVVALLCDTPQAVSNLVAAAGRAVAERGTVASPLVQDCAEARTTLTKKALAQP